MSDAIIRDVSARLEGLTNKTRQLVELLRQRHEVPEPLDHTPKGRHAHRLDHNHFERLAADHWSQEDRSFNTLAFLMGDGQEPGVVTERDRVVIATFTQWLGSNVGRVWARELIARFDAAAVYKGQR